MASAPTKLSTGEKALLLKEIVAITVETATKTAEGKAPGEKFHFTAPFVRYPGSSNTSINEMLVYEVKKALPDSLTLSGSAGPILYFTV